MVQWHINLHGLFNAKAILRFIYMKICPKNVYCIICMILLILGFLVFICSRSSRICSRSLSISCAIIVVFSTRIFQNLNLGIEWVLRCKARELKSSRCTVSHLERVVVIRSTDALFSLETFKRIYHFGSMERSSRWGSVIRNN